MSNQFDYDVIIVGGGMAGLRAAQAIQERSGNFLLLEKEASVGGRVRTETYGGFQLDRGFQILLTRYPELRQVLDYPALDLNYFKSGAIIRSDEELIPMVDPLSHPLEGVKTLFNGVGTVRDRWLVTSLRTRLRFQSISDLLNGPDTTTESFLREYGFSGDFIERFFRPFLSGVFLESDLSTSSRMFKFVYKMFSEGKAALPAGGMQEIPDQMVRELPDSSVRTNRTVQHVDPHQVRCADGTKFTTRAVIVATGGWELDQLNGLSSVPDWNDTTCMYFDVDEPPVRYPILFVNSNSDERINNLCFPSLVSGDYSPPGKHLLSVSLLGTGGDTGNQTTVEEELVDWFGSRARKWTHLKTVQIPHALPRYIPSTRTDAPGSPEITSDPYICGDHLETPSLNGALASGRKTANRVLKDLELD